jgi:hypothetical protein
VNSTDDRGGTGVDRLQHSVEAQRVLDVLVVGELDRRALPLDVSPGAEARPVSGEDDDTGVAGVGEGLVQLADQLGIEGVAALRFRQSDAKDGAVALDTETAHRG